MISTNTYRKLQIYDITSDGTDDIIKLYNFLSKHFDNLKTNKNGTTKIYYKDDRLVFTRCDIRKRYFVNNSLYRILSNQGYEYKTIASIFMFKLPKDKNDYVVDYLHMDLKNSYYMQHKTYMI